MKRAGWIAALVVALTPAAVDAQTKTVTGHPTKADIAAVADTFHSTFQEGGMQLTSQSIQACYDTPGLAPTQRTLCVLWDAAAVGFDVTWRRDRMGRGLADPGPVTPFLAPQAYAARRDSMNVLLFGTQRGAQEQYLGNAPGQVMELMTNKNGG